MTRRTAFLLLALVLYALAFQGWRGLWSPDEGRYVEVALGMLRNGDWVHPRLNPEQPHYTKPPLTYWAIASSMAVFGKHEAAVRLPNGLAFALTVLLVGALARRLVPARPWLPPLVYATSLGPYVAANVVTTDTLLTLWETLAVASFVEAWNAEDEARRRRFLLGMWCGLGLAFLTKGPPALLPLLGVAVFVVVRKGMRELPRLAPPLSVLTFLLLSLSWYVKVVLDRPELTRQFLAEELINRITTDAHNRNPQWYGALTVYGATFLLGAFPWTIPLVGSIAARLRGGAFGRRVRAWLGHDENLLPALWLCLPLVVFFGARSRLPFYVLPLFAPLALLGGRMLADRNSPRRRAWVALGAWMTLLVAGRLATAWITRPDHDDRAFASGISRLVLRPREVAFIGTPPRYGVGFYLDSEVERLVLSPTPTGPVETLREAWPEDTESPRVFVLPPGLRADFEGAALAAGFRPERLGEVSGLLVVRTPSHLLSSMTERPFH